MVEKLEPKSDYPRPDAKPGLQGGDANLIVFLRSMGVEENEAEREAIEAYNRFLEAYGEKRCKHENNL